MAKVAGDGLKEGMLPRWLPVCAIAIVLMEANAAQSGCILADHEAVWAAERGQVQ